MEPLCASLLVEHMGDFGFLITGRENMASPSPRVGDAERALNELPVSVCHRYRVSPAAAHTGS